MSPTRRRKKNSRPDSHRVNLAASVYILFTSLALIAQEESTDFSREFASFFLLLLLLFVAQGFSNCVGRESRHLSDIDRQFLTKSISFQRSNATHWMASGTVILTSFRPEHFPRRRPIISTTSSNTTSSCPSPGIITVSAVWRDIAARPASPSLAAMTWGPAARTADGPAPLHFVDVIIAINVAKLLMLRKWLNFLSLGPDWLARSHWLPLTSAHFQCRIPTGRQPHQARSRCPVHLRRWLRRKK